MKQTPGLLKLILLISCCHALVHLLEQSVASVEQLIVVDLGLARSESGDFGFAVRLPFGLGALAAGFLADRFGARRLLLVYLVGSAITAMAIMAPASATALTVEMAFLGSFLSIYHPAGLAIISNETTLEQRARALGLHGVFGSVGIAASPLIAGIVLWLRPGDWRFYFLMLGIIAALLAVLIWFSLPEDSPARKAVSEKPEPPGTERMKWVPYCLLMLGTGLAGIVYGGTLHFLSRYLTDSGVVEVIQRQLNLSIPATAFGPFAAALALICGAFGQWTAGRIARPNRLPWLLIAIYALNIPLLAWMASGSGLNRILAASVWAFIHFMSQPIYNSLLPEFIPRHRRSAGFGLSNLIGFGLGAVGPLLVSQVDGRTGDYVNGFYALAIVAGLAALCPLPIAIRGMKSFQTPEED